MQTIIRKATKEDMPAVWKLIYELAEYEKAPEQVLATPESMVHDGFVARLFDCLVAINEAGEVIGTAVYYFGYSTWKGKMLYLDDLVVTQNARQFGVGMQLMEALFEVYKQANAQQMRWHVLDWNEPAIRFYEKIGAELDPEWIQCKFYPQ